MAACGAKVLVLRSVEYARRYDMPIHVRSSFSNKTGTWVTGHAGEKMESSQLSTVQAGAGHRRRAPAGSDGSRRHRPVRIAEGQTLGPIVVPVDRR